MCDYYPERGIINVVPYTPSVSSTAGERGQHARAALGVVSLGADAPVEIEIQVRE